MSTPNPEDELPPLRGPFADGAWTIDVPSMLSAHIEAREKFQKILEGIPKTVLVTDTSATVRTPTGAEVPQLKMVENFAHTLIQNFIDRIGVWNEDLTDRFAELNMIADQIRVAVEEERRKKPEGK
ncbi:MAG: hypothetical protein ACRCSF_03000 [Mycobacteriaceae bacterium]